LATALYYDASPSRSGNGSFWMICNGINLMPTLTRRTEAPKIQAVIYIPVVKGPIPRRIEAIVKRSLAHSIPSYTASSIKIMNQNMVLFIRVLNTFFSFASTTLQLMELKRFIRTYV